MVHTLQIVQSNASFVWTEKNGPILCIDDIFPWFTAETKNLTLTYKWLEMFEIFPQLNL